MELPNDARNVRVDEELSINGVPYFWIYFLNCFRVAFGTISRVGVDEIVRKSDVRIVVVIVAVYREKQINGSHLEKHVFDQKLFRVENRKIYLLFHSMIPTEDS